MKFAIGSASSGQLRFCLRATVAALVALAIANSLNFPLHGSWMVLTAVVVTQVSVGGSLRDPRLRRRHARRGGLRGGSRPAGSPCDGSRARPWLTLAVAPLSLAAALRPSFRVAPFSAVLVLLIGGALGENPAISAVVRVLEVALGGVIAAAVSIVGVPRMAPTNWESRKRRGSCVTWRASFRRFSTPSRKAPI